VNRQDEGIDRTKLVRREDYNLMSPVPDAKVPPYPRPPMAGPTVPLMSPPTHIGQNLGP
jgi:hypothetical protein